MEIHINSIIHPKANISNDKRISVNKNISEKQIVATKNLKKIIEKQAVRPVFLGNKAWR